MTTETMARTGVYEGMFLASQGASSQFGDLIAHINDIFDRAGATVISMRKWDDRRLAYEIDKQKRGVYILAYFSCPTGMVPHIERDVQISEKVLRALIIRADHLTDEEIATQDDRQALADEARFRADRAESGEEESSSKARLGAPEQARQSVSENRPGADSSGSADAGGTDEADTGSRDEE